jgi:AcrR family transcriptional regulator
MTRRAELEAQTRLRITESAVALHGTLGPSRTSISAIAEHAGVRRSTVYRHFPDEAALFAACSAHWRAANPVPEAARWQAIEEPAERLRVALDELYAHYRRTEGMRDNIVRDEGAMPTVQKTYAAFRAYLAAAVDVLMLGRGLRGVGARRVRAAIGHSLTFATWQSLAREQGLDDRQAADLMCRLVAAAAEG